MEILTESFFVKKSILYLLKNVSGHFQVDPPQSLLVFRLKNFHLVMVAIFNVEYGGYITTIAL